MSIISTNNYFLEDIKYLFDGIDKRKKLNYQSVLTIKLRLKALKEKIINFSKDENLKEFETAVYCAYGYNERKKFNSYLIDYNLFLMKINNYLDIFNDENLYYN